MIEHVSLLAGVVSVCLRFVRGAGLAVALTLAGPFSAAQGNSPPGAASIDATGGGGTGDPTPFVTAYFEQGNLVRAGESIQALGPDLMGDKVNEYTGSLEFSHTDVSLPGNSALPVAVGRRLATGSRQPTLIGGLFGDWDLDIPHLHTLAGNGTTNNWFGNLGHSELRCSAFSIPPFIQGVPNTLIPPKSWWDGYHLYVPGSGDQTLLGRQALINPSQPTDGNTYPVLTKENWQLRCLPTLANGTGEGFMALAPDGTTYRFDHIAKRGTVSYHPITGEGTVTALRNEIWILPSQITDRFGNWVKYTYDPSDDWKLMTISASDGRSISITYVAGTRRIFTVSDGTRTWTYGYNVNGSLQSVQLPDQSRWTFALQPLEHSPMYAVDPLCDPDTFGFVDQTTYTGVITHPSGATGSFKHKAIWHGTSNVPGAYEGCGGGPYDVDGVTHWNEVPAYAATYSLTDKTLSGPGMPAMTWHYDYSPANGSFAPVGTNIVTKTVTITDPKGNVSQNTYGTQYGVTEGLLLASAEGVGTSSPLRSTTYSYRPYDAGPYPPAIGWNGGMPGGKMSTIYTPQTRREITQQGVTFTWDATKFDTFARPIWVTRSSGAPLNQSISETTDYLDDTTRWVLGQVRTRTAAGLTTRYTRYNPSTSLPDQTFEFGKLVATYAFNTDGTLQSITDGANHKTSFSAYKRGLAQRIDYADTTYVTGVVNNIGLLDSVTNEAGKTWSYGYDSMGRIARVTYPTGDPVAYKDKTLLFEKVSTAEVGLPPNHWRQTITEGNATTINYFDARWRKVLTSTYDASSPSTTRRQQLFRYDPYNRTTFASYPARTINAVTDTPTGTTTEYDALGRPTKTLADSELGVLTSNTDYLAGFQTRQTNPKRYATTFSYQAFDEPKEDAPVNIQAPEGVTVAINRDVFGKPLSISRSGSYGGGTLSATRRYVYDGFQLLCKTIEPETKATIQAFDAANNLSWRASGLNLLTTSRCDRDSVPEASKVAYAYDPRNRLTGTGFGDGSPSIGRSYTPDGLPWTVLSGGSTWTYTYNNRRLLTDEKLDFNSRNYLIKRSYDANGHLSTLTYPDAASVSYSPNALGEPTQVSGYVSGVGYHPNGAVSGYTLANGAVRSVTQNTRGLPWEVRDIGVLWDKYTYDANANITAIADLQQSITSRSMGYDGLDRLTRADALGTGMWGNGSFTYDPLDNLRTSLLGSRNTTHSYDPATNRLTGLTTNGVLTSLGYDAQGNVSQRGNRSFVFDRGNRMSQVPGLVSYTYDGWGRRTSISTNAGVYQVQVYSQDGQLLYGSKEQAGQAMQTTRYLYLNGKELAEDGPTSGKIFTHTDQLGSPVARTNASGTVLTRTRYEPYGKVAAGTVPSGIGFTGHVNDPGTELVYMQQRYYDPIAGRFLSVDPITTDANTGKGFNIYEYAQSNPYRYTDPDGREEQSSVTIKLPPPTGSNIPSTVTVSSTGAVTTTNMGMSPGSGFMVITGGRKEATNPFGHSAAAVGGSGVYSYGNFTSLGSDPLSYIKKQGETRDQQITILPTTAQQNQGALSYFARHPDMNSVGIVDNCTVRTNEALGAAGVRTGATPFPGSLAREVARLPGARTFYIHRGAEISQPLLESIRQFSPPPVTP